MKSLIVFSDVTIDGFMAGPNNDLDFMVDDPERDEEMPRKLMSTADTIIIGRKVFSDMAPYWTTAEGDLAAWMNATPKFVLSRNGTYDVSAWQNATLAAGDGADQVRRLKATSSAGSLVIFGGVQTVRALVAANLVDEFWLKIYPVIVGRGGSMFSDISQPRALKLRSTKAYPSGTIAAIYSAPSSRHA